MLCLGEAPPTHASHPLSSYLHTSLAPKTGALAEDLEERQKQEVDLLTEALRHCSGFSWL